ncbi:MAG: hypothetical protein M3143_00980 [Actinomycetota bacterium]|nr:hypothetical protein [Actinomycetota bacterium]
MSSWVWLLSASGGATALRVLVRSLMSLIRYWMRLRFLVHVYDHGGPGEAEVAGRWREVRA